MIAAGSCRRYRLVKWSWMVVREAGQSSPRVLSKPEAVGELARDLARAADDDREHFWVVFVNAQNHYQGVTEVSSGTLSASLVHPRTSRGNNRPKQAIVFKRRFLEIALGKPLKIEQTFAVTPEFDDQCNVESLRQAL